MSGLQVDVLGPLRLTVAGEPVRLHSRKQRLLLAALLVRAPRSSPAERLVDVLWDDELPADPLAALQVHVSRLRRALSPPEAGPTRWSPRPTGTGSLAPPRLAAAVADELTVVACTMLSEGLPVAEATVVARREPSTAGGALRHVVRPPFQTLGGWSAATVAPSPLQRVA